MLKESTFNAYQYLREPKRPTTFCKVIIPGRTFSGSPSGASLGGIPILESLLEEIEGGGAGTLGSCSLLHSSEQFVFQKPTLSFPRSYVTSVLRTTIPVSNMQ